jgi:hypothetical protein
LKKFASLSAAAFAVVLLAAGFVAHRNDGLLVPIVHAAGTVSRPSTVIHVITIHWKDGVTAEQKATFFKATGEMAANLTGVKSLWLKPIKVQGPGFTDAIVMEFESQAAFDAYTDSPAHRQWEKVYLPLREESRTHDVTN